jgi:hypothetical protein
MPQTDKIHLAVRRALEKMGWKIVKEPLNLEVDDFRVFIDISAESTVGNIIIAEQDIQQIAVEIKSFAGPSFINEFQKGFGQYLMYLAMLKSMGYPHTLFLAVPDGAYDTYFSRPLIQRLIDEYGVKLVVVSVEREEIVKWTN